MGIKGESSIGTPRQASITEPSGTISQASGRRGKNIIGTASKASQTKGLGTKAFGTISQASTIAESQPVRSEYYYDLGSLSNQPIQRSTFLRENQYEDNIYEFDTSGTRNINLSLNNISRGDDADLYLYQDSNSNGIFDDSDIIVDYSVRFNNSDEAINYQGGRGTYFARVNFYSSQGDDRIDYNLDLSADFTGSSSSTLAAEIVDFGEVYAISNSGGTSSEDISLDRGGDYFVEVYQYSGDTSYTLQFDQELV